MLELYRMVFPWRGDMRPCVYLRHAVFLCGPGGVLRRSSRSYCDRKGESMAELIVALDVPSRAAAEEKVKLILLL